MRHADDSRLDHAGKLVDFRLHLLRVDVKAARNDEVLRAAHDREISVFIDPAQVAGDEEPVVAKLVRRLFRHVPVAAKDVRTRHLHNARLVPVQNGSLFRCHADADARQRKADRAGTTVTVVRVGGDHACFRHPVALEDGVAGLVAEAAMGFVQKRRGARDEKAHSTGRVSECGLPQEACIERRHAHHRRGTRHRGEDGIHIELREDDHRRARHDRHIRRHEQAVGVENGKRVDQPVRGCKTPEGGQRGAV